MKLESLNGSNQNEWELIQLLLLLYSLFLSSQYQNWFKLKSNQIFYLFIDSQVINKQPAPLATKDEDLETDNEKVEVVEKTIVKQMKTMPKQQVQKKTQSKKGLSFNQYLFFSLSNNDDIFSKILYDR